jgi:hypothetical protein
MYSFLSQTQYTNVVIREILLLINKKGGNDLIAAHTKH